MAWIDAFRSLKSSEHRLAWLVAMAADAIQIVGFPIFVEGAISPADSWYVTRQQMRPGEPEILPPGPAPEAKR